MNNGQRIRKGLILISLLLFPVTVYYFSPYLIIDGAFRGIITGSFLLFGLLFFSSLIFGRAFCAYLCPMGGFGEMLFPVNSGSWNKGNWVKYAVWFPWIAVIITAFILSGGFKKIDPLYMTEHGISVSNVYAYVIYYGILSLGVVLSLINGKRAFCHNICWMAPFMIIGSKIRYGLKIPFQHLSVTPSACTGCGNCTRNCPMSLNVEKMVSSGSMRHDECILCGECAAGCKTGTIHRVFGTLKD